MTFDLQPTTLINTFAVTTCPPIPLSHRDFFAVYYLRSDFIHPLTMDYHCSIKTSFSQLYATFSPQPSLPPRLDLYF